MDLICAEHHVYRLDYHLVWTPKYRCKAFKKPYSEILKQIFIKIAYDYDMDIKEIEIPTDHVHMLVSIPPHPLHFRCHQHVQEHLCQGDVQTVP